MLASAREFVRRALRFEAPPSADDIRRAVSPGTWCLDRASIEGAVLTCGGWAVRLDGVAPAFTINGRRFENEDTRRNRPDLSRMFALVADASHAGFECQGTLRPVELDGSRPVEIQCVDPQTGAPWREQQAFFVPVPSLERWPLPDPLRMKRVHGGIDADSFRIVGYSNFMKLDWALRRTTGNGFEGRGDVLDWGCGSGRLLRYMDRVAGISVTGVDIDADNVAWCRAHLPFASYHAIPLQPPSSLPTQSFDLLVGISVFTHLTEAVQHSWLMELQRLARPGAVLLMTIHGPTVTATAGNSGLWNLVQRRGFVDGASTDLDDVIADKSYYRNSFHTHEYIREKWSRYFDVVDIIEACIGNAQDLVVMRAR